MPKASLSFDYRGRFGYFECMMETEPLVPQPVHEKPSNYDAFARAAAGLAGLLLLTILVLLLFQEQSGFKVYRKSGVLQFETEQVLSSSVA